MNTGMTVSIPQNIIKHHYDDDDDYYKHLKSRKAEKKYWKERRKIEHKYHHKDYDRQLRKMVAYAARGGRDVKVWRVSDDTYVVKYLQRRTLLHPKALSIQRKIRFKRGCKRELNPLIMDTAPR